MRSHLIASFFWYLFSLHILKSIYSLVSFKFDGIYRQWQYEIYRFFFNLNQQIVYIPNLIDNSNK